MTLHPPYYFLDFWAVVIIGSAAFALVRHRRRRRHPRAGAGAGHGAAHDRADADVTGHRSAPVRRSDEPRQPRDPA